MSNKSNPFGFEKAEESTGFLLWQVISLWQRDIRRTLEPLGITHSQFVLLASIHWLTLSKQDVTQAALASHTKIDPMTTSTVLRTLQTRKLIVRQPHSTDTRAKVVTLTPSGRKVVMEAVKLVEKFDQAFFAKLKSEVSNFNKKLLVLLAEG